MRVYSKGELHSVLVFQKRRDSKIDCTLLLAIVSQELLNKDLSVNVSHNILRK